MKAKGYFRSAHSSCVVVVAAAVLTYGSIALASGPLEKTIYSFQGSPDGTTPFLGALVADRAGNLYGTTGNGGSVAACVDCGTVFELSPPSSKGSAWTETQLYSFQGGASDGKYPYSGLVFDKQGNLYGTTVFGPSSTAATTGTIFKLSPPASQGGSWTETLLYLFPADGSRGLGPYTTLVFDTAGNLYGTTNSGGVGAHCACGTAFELSPPETAGGAWTQTVLHNFGSFAEDGATPDAEGGLIFDRHGALYGVTQGGGKYGYGGTVYQLVRENGQWSENILYDFSLNERAGNSPRAPLTFDSVGNLYVSLTQGGVNSSCSLTTQGCGAVFKLAPPSVSGDLWKETILYSFGDLKDGRFPNGGLILDKAGNIYGTTSQDGLKNKLTRDNGTIFRLTPPTLSGGPWTETTVHEFGGSAYHDGTEPTAGLTFVNGKFYGTTALGGPEGFGTVFSLVIVP